MGTDINKCQINDIYARIMHMQYIGEQEFLDASPHNDSNNIDTGWLLRRSATWRNLEGPLLASWVRSPTTALWHSNSQYLDLAD